MDALICSIVLQLIIREHQDCSRTGSRIAAVILLSSLMLREDVVTEWGADVVTEWGADIVIEWEQM